jgi:SAM-dependent methyltransferase
MSTPALIALRKPDLRFDPGRLHHGRMPSPNTPMSAPPMPASATRRWDEMLRSLAALLPAGPASVLIDGGGEQPAVLAARLAARLTAGGRTCARVTDGRGAAPDGAGEETVWLADGPGWRAARALDAACSWDLVIWVLTPPADGTPGSQGDEYTADIVIDMYEPDWPVIRRVAAPLAARGPWYLTETRAFFSCRAATWNTRFGDDMPAYAAAVARAGIRRGGVAIDVGCGTGRAVPALRQAVGPDGAVIAADLTPEMLDQARQVSKAAGAALVLADARRLPFADASADALFAAGLVNHLPDTEAGLGELARVTRPGGLLVLFHPSGRAALAARHGRTLSPDEPLAAGPLGRSTLATGWRLTAYDDAVDHFFALAVRQLGVLSEVRYWPGGPQGR